MIETVIEDGLGPGWSYVSDIGEAGEIGEEPVGVHDRGAELFADEAVSEDPADYLASMSYPVTVDGIRTEIVVATESFDTKQALYGFVRNIGNAFSDHDVSHEAIAVVPHEGSITSVDLDPVVEGDSETIVESRMADVFCIDTSDVSEDVDIDDVYDNRMALIYHVYGLDVDGLENDAISTLESTNEAFDQIGLDIYTITTEEMELHETEPEQPAE